MGFMREMGKEKFFYSKDAFWWTGRPIVYSHIDEWTGWKDKNRMFIYEWDIVRCKIDPDSTPVEGVVLWEQTRGRFGIRMLHDDSLFIPLIIDGIQMFDERQIEVFSYLFLNPDLRDQLGLSDD